MNTYRIIGFLNMFDIIPDFVYPVFRSTNNQFLDKLFIQSGENDKNFEFIPLKESIYHKVINYRELNKIRGITVTKEFTILDKPIYAFQINDKEMICGDSAKMIRFFKSYTVQDCILEEEIKDFKKEIKQRSTEIIKNALQKNSFPQGLSPRLESKNHLITHVCATTESGKLYRAKVLLVVGTGKIIINGESIDENLRLKSFEDIILQPFAVTNNTKKYDVFVRVTGGRFSEQARLISHGIALILFRINHANRKNLKDAGLFMPYMARKKYNISSTNRKPRMIQKKDNLSINHKIL